VIDQFGAVRSRGPARSLSIAFFNDKDRETSAMRLQAAIKRRALRFGCLLPAMIALGACTNTTSPASTNASSGAVRVAGDSLARNETHSVDAVSDALGQRLDAMVGSRQTGH
jgi:hypothetical protein